MWMGTLAEVALRKGDCVKDDMRIKGVSMEMTSDRRKHVVPTQLRGIRGR
jgi:hypothetical protein